MGLDRKVRKGVLEVEEEVYQRTSVSNTRLRYIKMRIEVDISAYAIGGILSMEYKDRKWRLVVFLSKSLNETERNYRIYDKEMLVVIML